MKVDGLFRDYCAVAINGASWRWGMNLQLSQPFIALKRSPNRKSISISPREDIVNQYKSAVVDLNLLSLHHGK